MGTWEVSIWVRATTKTRCTFCADESAPYASKEVSVCIFLSFNSMITDKWPNLCLGAWGEMSRTAGSAFHFDGKVRCTIVLERLTTVPGTQQIPLTPAKWPLHVLSVETMCENHARASPPQPPKRGKAAVWILQEVCSSILKFILLTYGVLWPWLKVWITRAHSSAH